MLTIITGYDIERFKEDEEIIWMPVYDQHPSKQSAYGRDIANQASYGDIAIATHSEYIFNGARLAHLFDKVNFKIIFYTDQGHEVVVIPNKHGRFTSWPKGMFDQVETDLAQIIEWGIDEHKKERIEKEIQSS